MTIDISWGQVITIFITQAVSAATTFYVLRTLGMLHNKETAKKIRKNVKKAVKEMAKES